MEEKILKPKNGMAILFLIILLIVASVILIIFGDSSLENNKILGGILIGLGIISFILGLILAPGLKIIKPQEALVLTLFGEYKGSIKEAGFYFVNPFSSAVNPAHNTRLGQSGDVEKPHKVITKEIDTSGTITFGTGGSSKKISLKIMTLSNKKQKVNDVLGNPVEIGIAVMWRVIDTSKAVFNVDNFKEYLSLQVDSAVRNIVKTYPYDIAYTNAAIYDEHDEGSLRGSSEEVAGRIRKEIQSRVEEAGLEIIEARITYLAYSPEIAAAMLQRQQASAVIDARKMIVDGAVGMVEMALDKLKDNEIVELDEERKAAMVSNLLVVLCSSRDTQPIVNSGSLY